MRHTHPRPPRIPANQVKTVLDMYFIQKMKQQDIAAYYGVNQGRISEIVKPHKNNSN